MRGDVSVEAKFSCVIPLVSYKHLPFITLNPAINNRYESLVQQPEEQLTRIVQALNLTLEPAMLQHHHARRIVQTNSMSRKCCCCPFIACVVTGILVINDKHNTLL